MKITRFFAHRVELPLHETTYKWSGGKSVTVAADTERGLGIAPKMDVLGKVVVEVS